VNLVTSIGVKKYLSSKFQVKISHCGTERFAATYKLVKNESALALLLTVVACMSADFVGKENRPHLVLDLALSLLKGLYKPETLDDPKLWEQFKADIKKVDVKDWVME